MQEERERQGDVYEQSRRDWEKRREKRERELVEARCTPQSRPGCLVAAGNQT